MSDISSIREQSRQDYLKAMGIQTWFPRCVLPNAQPAREFELPEVISDSPGQMTQAPGQLLQDMVQPDSAAPETLPVSARGPADVLAQTVLVDTPAKPEVSQKVTSKKPEPKKSKGPVSQFRLVTLSPTEDCLVIAEMPHTGLNQFTRFHQRLLDDMLRALNLSNRQAPQQPGMSEFVWPMGNQGLMGQISQDDNAAADAVCAYLSNQFGLARRKVVLLLGRAAARFVIDPDRPFDQLRGIQTGLHAEQWFAASFSLNELMKVPALKSETWKDLSPLRERLSG